MTGKKTLAIVLGGCVLLTAALAAKNTLSAAGGGVASAGRYSVEAGQDSEYVLCDTATGKAWFTDLEMLEKNREVVWLPIAKRLETQEELAKWLEVRRKANVQRP